MDTHNPILSIVIVNWNGSEPLLVCLESLHRHEDTSSMEIIVSDNASTDSSVAMLKELFPAVRIIENGENLGFGAGNNRALAVARGEYVLMLNPDMEFTEPGLKKLIGFMAARPAAGLVGCYIENPDGSFMRQCRRGYPDPLTAFYKASGLIRLFPRHRRIAKYFYGGQPEDAVLPVDAVSGSFMLARREALKKAGDFCEEYFMYVEDVDLCKKIRAAGYEVLYAPLMRIRHHGGRCVAKMPRRSAFYHYHMTRSHLVLYQKDGSLSSMVFWPIVLRYLFTSLFSGNRHLAEHLREFFAIRGGAATVAMRRL